MSDKDHWENVYETKAADAVSWYSAHLPTSLRLITQSAPSLDAAIIDVGGGEATLVDDLLAQGYRRVSVLDISQAAIAGAQQRLGEAASRVAWIAADITQAQLPESQYDVWHDRAVFHFLTEATQRAAYVRQLTRSVKLGGHVIIATFGPQGPEKCSGLPVARYDAVSLHKQLGAQFQLLESLTEIHQTPFATTQQFLYCHFKLIAS